MKSFSLSLLLLWIPYFIHAQSLDSAAIAQEVNQLLNLNKKLTQEKQFDEALDVIDSARVRAETAFGKVNQLYASCVFYYGETFKSMQKYEQAEGWFQEALVIEEKILGKESNNYMGSLNSLAALYFDWGLYEKAELLFLELRDLKERVFGTEHEQYAMSLNNLGVVYEYLSQYEKSEALYQKANSIQEKVLGKEHPDYAMSLNNLAAFYWYQGQFEKAEVLLLEAKAIYEKVTGKEHPGYTMALNNLGAIYDDWDQLEKAEAYYLEAHAIREKILGKEHPDYATGLTNLAILYMNLGQYEKAEAMFLESKTIMGKVLGKAHPNYASTLESLGVLYSLLGEYEQVESLLLETKAIREKVLGKQHPDYALIINNLAKLYQDQGQDEKAKPLFLDAKNIYETYEQDVGQPHPFIVLTLMNLARVHKKSGQYEQAESLFIEAQEIQEKIWGKMHHESAIILMSLGGLYEEMDQDEQASSLLIEAASIQQSLLLKAARHSSEQELATYTQKFVFHLHEIFSFTHLHPQTIAELQGVCYDQALFYKGFLLNASSGLRQFAHSDSSIQEKFALWQSYHRFLAEEYALPLEKRIDVTPIEEKANILEKELVRTAVGFGQTIQQIRWQEVQANLKPGEAAIEFVHYRLGVGAPTDSIMYAALVLTANDSIPSFIPLFEEGVLQHAVAAQQAPKASRSSRGIKPKKQTKKSRSALNWQHLTQTLEGIHSIYYSPSGLLHRLNLSSVLLAGKETFGDRFRLVQLNSTRQLVIPHPVATYGADAVLFGGVQYDLDSTSLLFAHTDITEGRKPTPSNGLHIGYTDRSLRAGSWDYLTWTEREVHAIEKTLESANYTTSVYTGHAATEEVFRQIGNLQASPRVIHLATHGFFFPDPIQQVPARESSDPGFKLSDHPMIRSGVILAGANHVWRGNPSDGNREDGILTAYEISQMNLSQTDLVVLSACETGLGDIQGNEGVYGLQRAFRMAGARYLIMSLWKVPDKETMEFMNTFYHNWLEKEMSIPQAFRTTQQSMRKKYKHLSAWAAFVLVE